MHPRTLWRVSIAILGSFILLGPSRPSAAAEQYSFVTQWGGPGSAPGSFSVPFNLAVDSLGNVYVADAGNNRIQKFSSSGDLLTYWGSLGTGPGQFDWPQGIAVDISGSVYVTDVFNHRVERFTSSGLYLGEWGYFGSANGAFAYPAGVATEPHLFGYVFVAEPYSGLDSSNVRIQRFTSTGSFVSKWPGQFSPQDVAVDATGNVFVVDDYRVVKYTSSGVVLGQWGSEGTGVGQFDLPGGICVDAAGNVYVADTGNHRIQKFSNTGTFLTQWGSFGTGAGQFRFPADVAVDDSGGVYVSDQSNSRIQKFAPRKVLLVHGICGDADAWDPFAQVLADSGFSVDRLQYGNPSFSLRPSDYVSVLASKLATMGPGPIAVVAHSMGGLITRDYIRRQILAGRPNRVAQLVTLGSPHHGSDLVARILSWGPAARPLVRSFTTECLSSPYSLPALVDMLPGAAYVNTLNYGANAGLYDVRGSHGWSTHQPESALPGDVYIASIGGTGSYCHPVVRRLFWPSGTAYQPNDCTVATGAAVLTNENVFRAADPALGLEKPAAHTDDLTTPCGEAYYSFVTLAKRVATILRTSPAGPPLAAGAGPTTLAPANVSATVEDSLQMVPVLTDSIEAGIVHDWTITLPATSLAHFTLLSTDAHVVLIDPNATTITVADTSAAAGIAFYTSSRPGFEGFEITAPQPGTWTLRADASAAAAAQRVVGIVEYAAASAVQLSILSTPVHPGDDLQIRAQVTSGDTLTTDVAWTCSILQPDQSTASLQLYDDGAHGDSLANDGIYGNGISPSVGAGQYVFTATATAGNVGPLAAVAYGELANFQDLGVSASDILLSRNLPQAGDSLTIYAAVHNNSSMAVSGVEVEIRDLVTHAVLSTTAVDLAATSAVVIEAPWVPAAPDSHLLLVRVSPYVLNESDFANNSASRVVVLGEPLGVGPGDLPSGLRLDPPYPNPTSNHVVLAFTVPQAGAGALDIYDLLGRRVCEWRWTHLAPGRHVVEWDGRRSSGQRLSPGVYLCRLEVGDERIQRKVVLRH